MVYTVYIMDCVFYERTKVFSSCNAALTNVSFYLAQSIFSQFYALSSPQSSSMCLSTKLHICHSGLCKRLCKKNSKISVCSLTFQFFDVLVAFFLVSKIQLIFHLNTEIEYRPTKQEKKITLKYYVQIKTLIHQMVTENKYGKYQHLKIHFNSPQNSNAVYDIN